MNNVIYLKDYQENRKLAEECIRQREKLDNYIDHKMSDFLYNLHGLVGLQLQDPNISETDIGNTIAMFIEQFVNGVIIK